VDQSSVKNYNKIQKLCDPLKSLDIGFFYYETISEDGYLTNIGSNVDWLRCFADNRLYQVSPFYSHPTNIPAGTYFSKVLKNRDFENVTNYAKNHGIDQFLIVVEKRNGILLKYGFGLGQTPGVENLILNELPILKRFSEYFKCEMDPILKDLADNPFYLGGENESRFKKATDSFSKTLTHTQRIDLLIKLKLIDPDLRHLKLTKRELECVNLTLKNKTCREIGELLDLSTRTVENYLDNIKAKLNCNNRHELFIKLDQVKLIFPALNEVLN
jgi:DNA-binding CsgD family transcriptional regulator